MVSMRRWLAEALAEYRRYPRWTAAGLAVIAIALAAASGTWVVRQLSPPEVPAGALTPETSASTAPRQAHLKPTGTSRSPQPTRGHVGVPDAPETVSAASPGTTLPGNSEAQPDPPGAEDIAAIDCGHPLAIDSGHLAECVTPAIEFRCHRIARSGAEHADISYVGGEFIAITS